MSMPPGPNVHVEVTGAAPESLRIEARTGSPRDVSSNCVRVRMVTPCPMRPTVISVSVMLR